jgi:CheY-like chemotaxis protein
MVLAFKRIMIVTHNIQFAIDTKRALESLGHYEVTTVTDAVNVIEKLRNQAHNLVLLDIENLEIPAPEMVITIRKIQQEIAIILAPDVPDAHDIAVMTDVQGVVNIPVPVRQLMPVLESSVRDIYDNLPETVKAPTIDAPQETVNIETLVDELLGDDETPYFTSRQVLAQKTSLLDEKDHTTQPLPNTLEVIIESKPEGDTVHYVPPSNVEEYGDHSMRLFQKLAEEEPPIPNLNESGTISDLARNVAPSAPMPLIDDDKETETEAHQIDEEDHNAIPAILVLQTAINETTPIEAISLQTLYDNIQDRLPTDKQTIRPLPSWLKEGEKFIREPIFLEDNLSLLEIQRSMEYTSTTTQQADSSVVVSDSGDLETEVIDEVNAQISIADLEVAEDVDVGITEDVVDQINEDADHVDEAIAIDMDEGNQPDSLIIDEPPIVEVVPHLQPEDPYDMQLAVTLTQVSTELTAEATILTRDNAIVAYSGDMPMEDIEDLRTVIADDWTAEVDNARIRFITLPSSGKDFMLYSKGTVGGFTLSMIFAGTKQLRVIRRQGSRLINALEAIPEVVVPLEESIPDSNLEVTEETPNIGIIPLAPQEIVDPDNGEVSVGLEVVEAVDVGPKHPFTFIWLVDDSDVQLSIDVSQKLIFWIEMQLNSLHWTSHKLDVHQDFIYLHADVPGDLSPAILIRELMERSQKIALSEDDSLPEDLWADAYLVLTPGRDMTPREIQRFLNFARAEG